MYSLHTSTDGIPTTGWQVEPFTTKEEFLQNICHYRWSPNIWRGGRRSKANWDHARLVVLDFDDGMTIDQAKETFDMVRCIIGTTKSHRLPKNGVVSDRFRLILRPVEGFAHLDGYESMLKALTKQFGADTSCTDGARWFEPCTNIVHDSFSDTGRLNFVNAQPRQPTQKSLGNPNHSFLVNWIKTPPAAGNRNKNLYQAAREMCKLGIAQQDCFIIARLVEKGLPSGEMLKTIDSAYDQPQHNELKQAKKIPRN